MEEGFFLTADAVIAAMIGTSPSIFFGACIARYENHCKIE